MSIQQFIRTTGGNTFIIEYRAGEKRDKVCILTKGRKGEITTTLSRDLWREILEEGIIFVGEKGMKKKRGG